MRKWLVFLLCATMFFGCAAAPATRTPAAALLEAGEDASTSRLTFVYGDRPALVKACKAAWGLVILLEFDGRRILFNAGGDEGLLRNNMHALGISPRDLDAVVISHHHWEMVDGIAYVLRENPRVPVYATDVIVDQLGVRDWAGNFRRVPGLLRLTPHVWLMKLHSPRFEGGPFGIDEVHIVVKTREGLVILQGCGHPRILNIMKKSQAALAEQRVYMIAGGTRLLRPGTQVKLPDGGRFTVPQMTYYSDDDYRRIADELLAAGVKKIVPTHCTGEAAEAVFARKFGENYIKQTLGMKIELPPPPAP